MKFIHIFWCLLLCSAVRANVYRCGDEYINNDADARARGCILIKPQRIATPGWDLALDTDDYRLYLHRPSLRRVNNQTYAWLLWSFNTPQTKGKIPEFSSYKELVIFRCKELSAATKQAMYYATADASDKALLTLVYEDFELRFATNPPASVGEELSKRICFNKAK